MIKLDVYYGEYQVSLLLVNVVKGWLQEHQLEPKVHLKLNNPIKPKF